MPTLPNPFANWDLPQAQYDRVFAALNGDVELFRRCMKEALRSVVLQRERANAMNAVQPMDIGDPPTPPV